MKRESGVTLMEVLVAMSLLSLLSVGMLMAMRVGLGALDKANRRLMENRRIVGAQRIIEQEIAGFIPTWALCPAPPESQRVKVPFFEGNAQSMRFVSAYSLQEAWRGRPQILEFLVIRNDKGSGVRLVVNESTYSGPESTGGQCVGIRASETGAPLPVLRPAEAGPASFVLADNLSYCRFIYLEPLPPPVLDRWRPNWALPRPPLSIRIEMAGLEDDTARLKPVTITAPVHVTRQPETEYADN